MSDLNQSSDINEIENDEAGDNLYDSDEVDSEEEEEIHEVKSSSKRKKSSKSKEYV